MASLNENANLPRDIMIESRFDIPASVAHVLRIAIENGVIDVLDAYALGSKHNGNWDLLVSEVCGFAFCSSKENHSKIAKAADAFFQKYFANEGL